MLETDLLLNFVVLIFECLFH